MTSQGQSVPEQREPIKDRGTSVGEGLDAVTTDVESESENGPSLDLVFGILKNSRRRKVIECLRQREEAISMSDLAEHIAAAENDTTPRMLTSKERKRVYVALYQCHLPKMDDIGVVDFNQDRGHITLTEKATDFEKYLDSPEEEQDRQWYQYYAAVSVLGAMVLAASVALSLPGSIILGLFSLVVGVGGACSVYHWSVEREEPDSE